MNLGHLRSLDAIVRGGSFKAAAEQLHLTPPAVSLRMRQLEDACGLRLFERIGRRVRLTAAGRTLHDYARRMFTLERDAAWALERLRGLEAGSLRVVSSETAAYYLPFVWREFGRRYPGIQVQLSLDNSERASERVLQLQDDLGVLSIGDGHPDLAAELLVHDPVVAVVPPAHPWARRQSVSLHDFEGQSLVLREVGSATRRLAERRFTALGIRWRMVMEIASNEVIKQVVEMGAGIGILSVVVIAREVRDGALCGVRIRDREFLRPLHLAFHRDRAESPIIHAFVRLARELRKRISVASAVQILRTRPRRRKWSRR
jgi:DNA-binding transcriptional LysR family regulator